LQGQMLLYLGENTATFVEQCSDMGEVFIHG